MTDDDILDHAPVARDLVRAVHARDPEKVHDTIAGLDRAALTAVALLLADVLDADAADRLDTLIDRDHHGIPATPTAWTDDELRAAHAAFTRRERTPWAVAGQREYDRRRKARRRKLAALEQQIIHDRRSAA